MLVLITKPKSGPTVMDPGNGVILNSDEQVVETDKRTRRMMVRRYFDASGNPTPASIVDAGRRNGFWNNNGGGGCGSCGSFNCGGGCQTGLPMVMNGGCGGCGGGMTVVGTTLINRHDPVQTAMFKQNALNASAASKQIWMQQNSYLYGGRR